jgi:hypothetical protein
MIAAGIFFCLLGFAAFGFVAWQLAHGCSGHYAQWRAVAARNKFFKYSDRYIWALTYANLVLLCIFGLMLIAGGVACLMVATTIPMT